MPRSYFCELIAARRYYGRHATGWVLLVNGHPHHYPGRDGWGAALDALEKFRAICKKGGSKCTSSSRRARKSSSPT